MNLAIVVSQFNEEITSGLLRGAKEYLEKNDVYVRETDIFKAPGSSLKLSLVLDTTTA
jgi:6,7-dimethyl-8-ribityllumazine synthase